MKLNEMKSGIMISYFSSFWSYKSIHNSIKKITHSIVDWFEAKFGTNVTSIFSYENFTTSISD